MYPGTAAEKKIYKPAYYERNEYVNTNQTNVLLHFNSLPVKANGNK